MFFSLLLGGNKVPQFVSMVYLCTYVQINLVIFYPKVNLICGYIFFVRSLFSYYFFCFDIFFIRSFLSENVSFFLSIDKNFTTSFDEKISFSFDSKKILFKHWMFHYLCLLSLSGKCPSKKWPTTAQQQQQQLHQNEWKASISLSHPYTLSLVLSNYVHCSKSQRWQVTETSHWKVFPLRFFSHNVINLTT